MSVAVDVTSYLNFSGLLKPLNQPAANSTFDLAAEKIFWDKGSANFGSTF